MITSPINKRFRQEDVSPIEKAEVGVARQISVSKGSVRGGLAETSVRAAQVVVSSKRDGGVGATRELGPMKPRLVEHRMSTATATGAGTVGSGSGAKRGQEMVAEVVHAI